MHLSFDCLYIFVCLSAAGDCLLASSPNSALPTSRTVQHKVTTTHQCSRGFFLNGTGNSTSESITCSGGNLSSVPRACIPMMCPPYDLFPNTSTVFRATTAPIGRSIGTTVNYSCKAEYRHAGAAVRVCQLVTSGGTAVGGWSARVHCVRKLFFFVYS